MRRPRPELRLRACAAGLLLALLIPPLVAQNAQEHRRPEASGGVELGGDSFQRRYLSPRLRFSFPWNSGSLFADILYGQRTNSRLRGPIDIWLRAGNLLKLPGPWTLETSLNHLSRHISLKTNSPIFDVNELLARIWFEKSWLRIGLGMGTYLGGERGYNSLGVLSFGAAGILGSEFSISGNVKFVNFDRLLYEFELSASLNANFDLFVRNVLTYRLPNTTYFGLRVKTSNTGANTVESLDLRAESLSFNSSYKLVLGLGARLEFFKTPRSRLLLSGESIFPVVRGNRLLGTFRPQSIRYPLAVEYERKAGNALFLFGYGRYQILLPLDVAQPFSSNLGLGIGLRNQKQFYRLEKAFRYEISAGGDFSRRFQSNLSIGLNTVGHRANLGGEVLFGGSGREYNGAIRLFGETNGEVKIRPFLGLESGRSIRTGRDTDPRPVIGLELFRWF